jgi:hypothetical protein
MVIAPRELWTSRGHSAAAAMEARPNNMRIASIFIDDLLFVCCIISYARNGYT